MEATISSRISLLSAGAIDFCPSENKIVTSSASEKCLTPIFPLKDFQKQTNFVDRNKNSIDNGYITLNGNKAKLPSVNDAIKEKIRTSDCNEKNVENDNSFLNLNGNKEKPLGSNHKEKIANSSCNERIKDDNSYITLNGNKEKSVNAYKEKIVSKEGVVENGMPVPKQVIYAGKIQVSWKHPRKIGAGLENMGNTCFMNTVIQCLTYCPPLVNYLLYEADHSSKCTIVGFCMMCILQRHIRRALDNSNNVIRPGDVYGKLRLIAKHFQHGRQEDAHEFLRYVIDNLWRSCLLQNSVNSKLDPASKETTIINQIFGGYHRSQVQCKKCNETSNTYDHFMDFILDIKQNVLTLDAALKRFVQPETLDNDNAYKCPKCKMKVPAMKKFTVHKAPNVATFQLKRFDYNRTFGGKITKQITYPEKLDLRPYMSDSKGEPVIYNLNAVLVHSGPTCNSGHYYCYVKNSDGYWYIMDDSRVHRVNLNQVLSQSAYVLFYVKSTPTENFSYKKSFENGIASKKIELSMVGTSKKLGEITTSKPLIQNNQFKQSSPKLKQPTYPTVNLNKRNGLSPNVNNREKIVFGIHNQSLKSQDSTPANKIQFHLNTSKTVNHETGLVPYVEDSSDSSDDDVIVNPNYTQGSSNCTPNSLSSTSSKPECFTSLNIKRKSSKPVLNINRLSNSGSLHSASPKVIATGVWTVTDARASSPGADSNSSVHSTTDWHVTSSKRASDVTLDSSSPLDAEKSTTKKLSNEDASPSHNSLNGGTKQRDFRKQETERRNAFFVDEEDSKESSFLKRKCSDSDSESLTNSKLCNGENQSSSVSKKTKRESEYVTSDLPTPKRIKSDTANVLDSPNKLSKFPKNLHSSESQNMISPHKRCVSPNYKSPKKTDSKYDSFENSKKDKLDDSNNNANCSNSSNSSLEYEWVEKADHSRHRSFKGNHSYEKDGKSHFRNANDKNKGQKLDVAKELTNNSKYLYGPSVLTWNGHNHYKEFDNKKRKSFENYEDEYDRGKVRKIKQNNGYTHFRKQNSFQEYSKGVHGYNKYGNRHYHGGHRDRPYNSHPKWKYHSYNNYGRRFKGK